MREMLMWFCLLGVPVRPPAKGLLRAPAKGAMCGRAVHACSPIDALTIAKLCAARAGLMLVSYMTLAPSCGASTKKASRYAKKPLIEKDTAAPTHSRCAAAA